MILYGAGGHGRVVSTICKSKLLFFFDQQSKTKLVNGFSVKKYDPTLIPDENILITIGDNLIRKKIVSEVSHPFADVIDLSVILHSEVSIGHGSQILHGAVVQIGTNIGSHCIINSSASIDHDCNIGNFVHIAPNCTLCGNVNVGEGSFIGAGSTIIPGIKIGKWSVIGAGSVVVKDIPDNVIAYGNPAKIIKERNEF